MTTAPIKPTLSVVADLTSRLCTGGFPRLVFLIGAILAWGLGYDRFGNIVGITAGHCADTVGDPVYTVGGDTAAPAIGRVDFISPATRLDYATGDDYSNGPAE